MKQKKCPICKKEIKGWNNKMIDYNMKQHILSQHPDAVNFHSGKREEQEEADEHPNVAEAGDCKEAQPPADNQEK